MFLFFSQIDVGMYTCIHIYTYVYMYLYTYTRMNRYIHVLLFQSSSARLVDGCLDCFNASGLLPSAPTLPSRNGCDWHAEQECFWKSWG